MRRGLLVIVGTLCIGLGAVGVVVPILPTTPFLLLAAACFLRSSERLNGWLLGNRVFGEYLRRYRDGEGLPLATKITVIALLWLTLGSSILIMFSAWWLRALLLAVGVGVTIHITRIKTDRRDGLTGERSPL
ncbi:MAG: YbaN family protein [Deltaproteobacteria bacterium]|nr:YbaN family protein [Deltaproteobacteria bacterium]